MSHHTANNTGKKLKSPGVILCLFLLLASAGFIAVLLHTKMLPGLYIAVLSTGILAVLCLIFWLTGDFHRRDRFVAVGVPSRGRQQCSLPGGSERCAGWRFDLSGTTGGE